MMVADQRHQQYLQPVRYVLSWIVLPLQYMVDQPSRVVEAFSLRLRTQQTLLRENQELRAKQSLLEFQLQRLQALENENVRLHELLGSTPVDSDKAQLAQIIHAATHPFAQRIVLNKGALDNVYPGQPVVNANGVVGQVLDVKPTTSVVLLISDITHALSVQNNRDETRSIAVGTGSPYELELSYVPNSAKFEVGDLLVTSGLGGRFPSGYPVGVVTEVDVNAGAAFMRIKVKPAAELDKVSEVLLMWPSDSKLESQTQPQAEPKIIDGPNETEEEQ
jgi:rod shape-determining protein MreC